MCRTLSLLSTRPRMQCFFLIGLGLFEEGRNYDGCLTPFDQEERLLWEYLRCPGDAFTLKIVQYMPLHAGPLQLFAAVLFRNRVARDTRAGHIRQSEGHFWSALDLQDTLVDPPVGASPDTGPATAREVVASWGIAPHHAAARIGGCRRRVGAAVNTIEMPACALFSPSATVGRASGCSQLGNDHVACSCFA